ncbi:hypothetical protein DFAR_1940004 [Desulfarculales bacterium]
MYRRLKSAEQLGTVLGAFPSTAFLPKKTFPTLFCNIDIANGPCNII